jgi:hypothetical protein
MMKIRSEYGFTANPFLSTRQNVIAQLRLTPDHEKTMSNLACHNLCSNTYIRASDMKLIGLGLNFCVTRDPPAKADLRRFERSVRIHYQFANAETTEYIPKLYVPVPSWMPQTAATSIEDALKTFGTTLREKHLATQKPRLNKPNLPPAQLKRLDEIRDDKRVIIIPTDKNLGPAIMDTSGYIDRCLDDHLLNDVNYRKLDSTVADEIHNRALSNLRALTTQDPEVFPKGSNGYKYFERSLNVRGRRRPKFYIMPKIHKNPMKTRPVISCIGSSMEIASKYLDYQLQRVIPLCPCYLRDGWQLMKELKDLGPLPTDARLVTADAVSMYSNIDTDHGIASVRSWLKRHRNDKAYPVDLAGDAMIDKLCDLLNLVMTTNIFDLDDTTWLQKKGTAMGTSSACAYATIYYSEHEELAILKSNDSGVPTLTTPTNELGIIYYRRFIDDAFIIQLTRDKPELYPRLQKTMNSFGLEGHRLEWTSEDPSKTVTFLDLTISIGDDQRISTKTFQKEMNLFLYIPPISSHSHTVLYGLIFGQLRRFWLQNTDETDFIRCASAFHKHLLARGHDNYNIQRLFRLAANSLDHHSKLKRATPTEPTSDARVYLHMEFHPRQIPRSTIQHVFRNVCTEPFSATANQAQHQSEIQLITAHHRPKNLRDLLCSTTMKQPENERVSDHILRLQQAADTARLNHP